MVDGRTVKTRCDVKRAAESHYLSITLPLLVVDLAIDENRVIGRRLTDWDIQALLTPNTDFFAKQRERRNRDTGHLEINIVCASRCHSFGMPYTDDNEAAVHDRDKAMVPLVDHSCFPSSEDLALDPYYLFLESATNSIHTS